MNSTTHNSSSPASATRAHGGLIHIGTKKRLLSYALYLAAIFFRAWNRLQKDKPKRVLLLEPFGLGDVITFEPLARELAGANFEVVFCSKPEWKPVLGNNLKSLRWFDLRLPWATHNERQKYRLNQYLSPAFRAEIRALRTLARGGVGIDTRGDIRSVLFLYAAGCRRVLSLSNYLGSDLKMWNSVAELVPMREDLRRWELNLEFMKRLSGPFPSQAQPPRIPHLINKSPNHRVALVPIAPWAGKLWDTARWQSLVRWLEQNGWDILGLCGPNQTAAARSALGPGVEIHECTSISHWADQFNRCSFAVTVDSGPMHVADALDLPVVALFGQGKLPLWAPSSPRSIVVTHQDDPDFVICHPIDENAHLGRKFMDRISVEEVIEAIKRLAKVQTPAAPTSLSTAQ